MLRTEKEIQEAANRAAENWEENSNAYFTGINEVFLWLLGTTDEDPTIKDE